MDAWDGSSWTWYDLNSLDLRRSIGDKRGQAATLYVLGNVSQEIGDLHQALEYLSQSLDLRRTTGDRRGEAASLRALGSCYGKLGEPQLALDYFGQSRKICREIGNREAQLALRKIPRWSHPYFWAGFTLQGDRR